jgi:hypothetical protein
MKTKTIYVHVGAEKTGSTSIQATCAENLETLAEYGLLYPHDPKALYCVGNTHRPLAASLLPDDSTFAPENKRDRKKVFPPLLDLIESSPCDKVLLSAEPFSSHFRAPKPMKELKKILGKWNVKIIIYVRRQDEFFASTLSTVVKGRRRLDFSGSFSTLGKNVRWQNEVRYNFYRIVSMWASVFGKENLIVRTFDRKYLVNGDIVDDLFYQIDPNIDMGKIQKGVDRNVSLNIHALLLLNLINTSRLNIDAPKRLVLVRTLEAYSRDNPLKHFSLISVRTRLAIMDKYRKSNRLLKNEYMGDIGISEENLFSEADIHDKVPIGTAISIEDSIPIVEFVAKRAPNTYEQLKEQFSIPLTSGTAERYLAVSIGKYLFS